MQITLNNAEFISAVHCYLENQGFDSSRFDISVRVIAGRTDSGVGARAEVNLEPKSIPTSIPKPVFEAMSLDTSITAPTFTTPSLFSSED